MSSTALKITSDDNPAPVPTPEDIYRAYPRKIARRAAISRIEQAVGELSHRYDGDADAAAVWLLERVERFAGSPYVKANAGPDRRQFVKHPSTWFHQGCYDDDEIEWGCRPTPPLPTPADAERRRLAKINEILDELRQVATYKWTPEARRDYVERYMATTVPPMLRAAPELLEFVENMK